jgi:hypothetical protein
MDLMRQWVERFHSASRPVQDFTAWISFFGALWVLTSLIANSIGVVSAYGWGVVAFVGMATACLLLLVISTCLFAWRYFRTVSVDQLKMSDEAMLLRKLDFITTSLSPLEQQNHEISAKINELERNIAELNAKNARESELLTKLSTKVQSDYLQLNRKFGYLIDAIHARDAEEVAKKADAVVSSLGTKLLTAVHYSNAGEWLKDYKIWRDSVSAIDRAVGRLGVEGHSPFLDIRHQELENCSNMPPDGMRNDHTIVPYKTVSLVQRRYTDGREQLFRFFAAKGALPG